MMGKRHFQCSKLSSRKNRSQDVGFRGKCRHPTWLYDTPLFFSPPRGEKNLMWDGERRIEEWPCKTVPAPTPGVFLIPKPQIFLGVLVPCPKGPKDPFRGTHSGAVNHPTRGCAGLYQRSTRCVEATSAILDSGICRSEATSGHRRTFWTTLSMISAGR